MDAIQKALNKLASLERTWADEIFRKLYSGSTKDLDIKKLKGREDIFRVRKGGVRIIYHQARNGHITIVAVGKRNDKTYSF